MKFGQFWPVPTSTFSWSWRRSAKDMTFFKIATTFYKMNPSWLNVTRNVIVIKVGDIFGKVLVMKTRDGRVLDCDSDGFHMFLVFLAIEGEITILIYQMWLFMKQYWADVIFIFDLMSSPVWRKNPAKFATNTWGNLDWKGRTVNARGFANAWFGWSSCNFKLDYILQPCFFFVSAQTNLSGSGPNRCERYELEYGRIVVANR